MSHVFSHTWERCRIWGGAEILGLVEFQLVLARIQGSRDFFYPKRAECARAPAVVRTGWAAL